MARSQNGGPLRTSYPVQANPTRRPRRRSLEAEQSTLGACLMDTEALGVARGILAPGDFERELHKTIFAAMIAVVEARQVLDIVTLSDKLREQGQLENCGGPAYLAALIEACPSTVAVGDYARIVAQYSAAHSAAQTMESAALQLSTLPDSTHETGETSVTGLLENAMSSLKRTQERLNASLSRAASYSDDRALDSLVSEVSWLWPGWIPRGSLSMLAGRPGVGKSTVALDLCRRLISHSEIGGGEWPDGEPIEDTEHVFDEKLRLLWIDTESALGIFRHRLNAWGIPRGHFMFPEGDELEPLRVDNDRDWSWIRGAVRDLNPPLVVLDSLATAHGGVENDNDYMKFVMRRLADLAADFNVAVLVIHHLNKLPAGMPDWPLDQDMIRGATAIAQLPRSIIGVGRPRREERTCGLMSVKLNIAQAPDALGYTTTEQGPAWGEAPVAAGAVSSKEKAVAFLLEFLANGPKHATLVYEECETRGICSRRTLEAAKVNIVKSYKVMDKWTWELHDRGLENGSRLVENPG